MLQWLRGRLLPCSLCFRCSQLQQQVTAALLACPSSCELQGWQQAALLDLRSGTAATLSAADYMH
jgi:hypothetical protein